MLVLFVVDVGSGSGVFLFFYSVVQAGRFSYGSFLEEALYVGTVRFDLFEKTKIKIRIGSCGISRTIYCSWSCEHQIPDPKTYFCTPLFPFPFPFPSRPVTPRPSGPCARSSPRSTPSSAWHSSCPPWLPPSSDGPSPAGARSRRPHSRRASWLPGRTS